MDANEPLLAAVGFLAAVVVSLVDGRNAVIWASLAAAVGLAPSVAQTYGAVGAVVLLGAALAAVLGALLSQALAGALAPVAGVDAVVPVVAAAEGLFGPRSVRVATAVLVLPAASWVSFNIPIGSASTVTGVLFPAAVVGGCAGMRLLAARTIADIAVGVAALGISLAATCLLSAGVDTLATAAAVAALTPAAAIAVGWVKGRHRTVRRAQTAA